MQTEFSQIDSTGILDLSGNITAVNVDTLRHSFREWYEGNPTLKNVVIHFGKVEMIDSAGLGLLISLLKQVGARGGDLKLAALSKRIRLVFEITRTHRIFEILDTREEAIAAAQ
jgi:anti-sigma B factor antagonist